jgi:DNA-binding CsgD family transcriptional regulator
MTDAITNLSKEQTAAVAAFIQACHSVSTLQEFRNEVGHRLRDVLPHAMFACGSVRMADRRIVEAVNLSFPAAFINGLVDEDKHCACPAMRRWVETRCPVFVHPDSPLLLPDDRAWLAKGARHGIRNVAIHGVMSLSQEHACYFTFGNLDQWNREAAFMLQLLVPHLHYALTHVEEFGNKRPKKILAEREQEVLKWICGGKSNSEMASILGISSWTVKIHVSNLLAKLNASTRGHAVAKAISFGLIEV